MAVLHSRRGLVIFWGFISENSRIVVRVYLSKAAGLTSPPKFD